MFISQQYNFEWNEAYENAYFNQWQCMDAWVWDML